MYEREIKEAIERSIDSNSLNFSQHRCLLKFPREICDLVELKTLDLSGWRIREIPAEIGNLIPLETLDLRSNSPSEYLYLGGNKIAEIPPELGNLVNLRGLYLEENQIKEIPLELGDLCNCDELNLQNNPITEIPVEIFKTEESPEFFLTYHPGLKVIPKEAAGYIYLNDVLIPDKYCGIPFKEWQPQWLIEEKNAELRRLLIQVIGYEKILAELQAINLDNWREYSLFKIDRELDIEPIVLLKMTCPSTNNIHVLRVPPDMNSAREAIQWVDWGIDAEEFSLET